MLPLRALIIEDSENDAILLVRELQRAGYSITSLRVDNASALQAALDQGPWDIVFADYTMPGFNAFAALEMVKKRTQDVPFIIVSGTIGEDLAVTAMKAGAHDYFLKNSLARLVPAVQRELREAAARREYRRTEEERAQLISIIEATSDMVGIADPRGNMIYLNAAGRNMMGVPPDEDISGSSIGQCYPPQARQALWEKAFPTAVREGVWSGESILLNRDRQEIPISQVIIAHRAPNGMVQFLSTIARDISERKQAEQALQEALAELRQTQQQIIQTERLHALRQMAGAIIHDVSNLMTPITGFTEMLLKRPESLRDPEQVQRNLELVNIAATDAANVVRRLQLFYQTPEKPVNWSRVDLNQVARQAAEIAEPWCLTQAQASGISINVETALQETPPVEGNEVELREALTNLIFNAVDAMPAGGTITLRTSCQDNQVALQVQDTGNGMTEEVLQRCLEPFFTTKGPQGTGLGLAVVYGAIQGHQGNITIESAVGQGTTITIRLPVPTEPAGVASPQQASVPPRPLRILVIDDEPLVLKVVAACLASDGHTVEEATSGRQALEKFGSGRFDLVLTDLAMPGMDGVSLAHAIKQAAPGTPVILLSGFADQLEASNDRTGTFDLILTKPVGLEQLRRALAQLIPSASSGAP